MDDESIFMDKSTKPTDNDLLENLESTYSLWKQLEKFVLEQYPNGLKEWNYPGKKYFKIAFVFGQKATGKIMDSHISLEIKEDLSQARK